MELSLLKLKRECTEWEKPDRKQMEKGLAELIKRVAQSLELSVFRLKTDNVCVHCWVFCQKKTGSWSR